MSSAARITNLYPKVDQVNLAPGRLLTVTNSALQFSSLSKTAATFTTNISTNANVLFTAATAGEAGNGIRIEYRDPQAPSQSLSVVVSNQNQITINLATDSSSAITTTGAQVTTAVNANTAAAALVTASNVGTGASVVTAVPRSFLTGGENIFRTNTAYVEITSTVADVYATFDGTTPSATNGTYLKAPTVVTWSKSRAEAAKFLAPSGTAKVYAAQLID